MKITNLDTILLSAPYREPTRLRSYTVMTVTTEDGRVGVGEAYAGVNAPEVCREAVKFLRPLFVGQDAEAIDAIIRKAHLTCEYFDHGGFFSCVVGAIDWALHDLAARRAGVPLHRLLNPKSRESVDLYASSGLVTWSIPQLKDRLDEHVAAGYRTIKIRVGCGLESFDDAVARAKAAAAHLNGRARLGVDAGQQIFRDNCWSIREATRLTEVLGDLGVRFFEDPLLITDLEGYRALCRLNKAPIAGGEMFNRPEEFDRYFAAEALHLAQPDACVLPGPRAVLQVASAGTRKGLRVAMHAWAGPVAQMQNIHAALAAEACEMVEYCPLFHPLLTDGLAPVWRFEGGRFIAPSVPGMGVTLSPELCERYRFQGVSSLIS